MNLSLYYHTLKHLKSVQIKYQLYYKLRKVWRKAIKFTYKHTGSIPDPSLPKLEASINNYTSYKQPDSFLFLNKEKKIGSTIDWNYNEYGKLWTYNLTYFEYLHQEAINKDDGLMLIKNFIQQTDKIKDGLEPFPTSLRIINWIKFLAKNRIQDEEIDRSLYLQIRILLDNLEYHLLGNHLLENGFALLFAAYYFPTEDEIYNTATNILNEQLNEQILPDGAHFELSPMYHQLMLYRLLDCLNLIKNNRTGDFSHRNTLEESAIKVVSKMLGWLKEITFKNGSIPMLNDSAFGIAPSSQQLFDYANQLGITSQNIQLNDSGYCKFQNSNYEAIVDVGHIGPDYIPGHAHADTLNIILHIHQKPFLVDTGISTYEANATRHTERSTSAHNTVQINDQNQSNIWSSFRVAQRAYPNIIEKQQNSITASHDGYRRIGSSHQRHFQFDENQIIITDSIEGKKTNAKAFFHFHPDIKVKVEKNRIITSLAIISFPENISPVLSSYQYAQGFNLQRKATKVIFPFDKKMKITLKLTPN